VGLFPVVNDKEMLSVNVLINFVSNIRVMFNQDRKNTHKVNSLSSAVFNTVKIPISLKCELPTFKQTLQSQPSYHYLATASQQLLLGKAFNNAGSDTFFMGLTQVAQCFRGTCCLHLQDQRISRQQLLPVFLLSLFFNPEDQGQMFLQVW
jgi:hypothetical protein